jgi:hypothetical protein
MKLIGVTLFIVGALGCTVISLYLLATVTFAIPLPWAVFLGDLPGYQTSNHWLAIGVFWVSFFVAERGYRIYTESRR